MSDRDVGEVIAAVREGHEGEPEMSVVFVAEVSSNHHRDLSRCLALIDKAAEIGCGAVKFQLFRIRELFRARNPCPP